MTQRPYALATLALLGAVTLAPVGASGQEALALPGTGIRSGGQTFLLGERRTPSPGWQRVEGAAVEYVTMSETDGRVVALRCGAPCATDAGVRTGEHRSRAEAVYGRPRREETLPETAARLLLYAGFGFELDQVSSIARIYVLPNT